MTSATPSKRRSGDRRRVSGGFTLIELLVVLSLLGILTSMVAPRFAGTVGAVEAEEAVRIVAAELQRLRAEAGREGRRIEVEIVGQDPPVLAIDVYETPRRPAWDFTPIDPAAKRAGATAERVVIPFAGSIDVEPPRIVFHADGRSSEATLHFMEADGRFAAIELRSRGIVRLDRPGRAR